MLASGAARGWRPYIPPMPSTSPALLALSALLAAVPLRHAPAQPAPPVVLVKARDPFWRP